MAQVNTFQEQGGRQFASRLNVSRFEVITDFIATNPVAMIETGTDSLNQTGRNQETLLHEIEFRVFLPTCKKQDTDPLPAFSSGPIIGLYQTYTFLVAINGQVWTYPVVFNQNIDRYRSRAWMAAFPTPVKSLAVSVQRDFIDAVWNTPPNVPPVALSANLEFYLPTP